MNLWTCTCGAENAGTRKTCKTCGEKRPPVHTSVTEEEGTHCICGAPLLASGLCQDTGLYPTIKQKWTSLGGRPGWFTGDSRCPFKCPICSESLRWDGGCFNCFGSFTPQDRNTWRFPGDRYDREDGNQHWVKTEGPRDAVSREKVRELRQQITGILKSHETPSA